MTAIPNDRKIRKEQIIGVVKEIQAGTNITVDDADPERPIISASGGGGVESVTGDGVDNTDPSNPVITSLQQSIGIFTPTVTATGAVYTIGNSDCIYIKTGRLVNFYIYITLSSTGTPSSRLSIENFPFTAQSSISSELQINTISLSQFSGSDLSEEDVTNIRAYSETNSATFKIRFDLIGDNTHNGIIASFPLSGRIKLSGSYISQS